MLGTTLAGVSPRFLKVGNLRISGQLALLARRVILVAYGMAKRAFDILLPHVN